MERSHLTRAAKYLADLRRRTAWRKIVSFLSVMVVFCTVYALVLPVLLLAHDLRPGGAPARRGLFCGGGGAGAH